MIVIFNVRDKSGRMIRLSRKQWTHITTAHAEMTNYLEDIEKKVINPLKIIPHTKVDDLRFIIIILNIESILKNI